jgi:hypothetical protein
LIRCHTSSSAFQGSKNAGAPRDRRQRHERRKSADVETFGLAERAANTIRRGSIEYGIGHVLRFRMGRSCCSRVATNCFRYI